MTGELVLVAGAPCSGKSTYVERHFAAGDALLDYDVIAAAIGGGRPIEPGRHDEAHHALVVGAYYGALQATRFAVLGFTVWAVRCAPSADERQRFRAINHADVVVLEVPAEVCIERARQRYGESELFDEYTEAIERWWRQYQRDPRDVVLTPEQLT